MESFKFLYLEACENLKITECEKLLQRIESEGNSVRLNLSGAQFSDSTCIAIGQALAKDVHIKELDCSSCMLSDEGLVNVLSGLEKNKFVVTLHLKGNNIRSSGTEALGKFLRHNTHLQNLYLEWNGLGIFPEKFALFCEGLCSNNSLKSLDLRNNQLNLVCAKFLSDVLLRNSSLQKLDIRWNNLGLAGGRALLKSLAGNHSILSLDVSGNDIHTDIMDAIKIATASAAQRFLANNEQIARSKYLVSKLEEKEQERLTQVGSLMERLEKMNTESSNIEIWNTKKLSEVESALAEKDKISESLTMKIQELESKLWSLTVEKNSIALSLNAQVTENKEMKDEFQSTLEKEKKKKEEMEKELQEHISSFREENLSMKQQIQELKTQLNYSENQNSKFEERIIELEKHLELEQALMKEQLLSLNKKNAEDMKKKEILHEEELSRLKEEFAAVQKSLKHKLSLLESQKTDLEQELKEKRAQIFSERSQTEEKLVQLEKTLKSDSEKIQQQLEERIEILEDANKEQYEHLQADLRMMHQLKTEITGLDLNLAEQEHEIEHLKKLLEEKDAKMKAHEAKVRLEVKEQLKELHDTKEALQKQIHEHNLLQKNIKEMETKHEKELEEKTKINENLKAEIRWHQRKLAEMEEDERKRSHQLQKAFETYLKPGARNENISNSGDASMPNSFVEKSFKN